MGYLGYKPADKPLTAADITDSIITSAKITDATIVNGDIANATIALAKLSATGTPSAATFLRGDNAWGEAGATAGQVIQVVTATDQTLRSTTSTSFVTASNTLSVSITPSATANKILVFAFSNFQLGGGVNGHATIYRGATNLGNGTSGMWGMNDNSTGTQGQSFSLHYLDSPSTTSSTTYQVYFRTNNSGATASINDFTVKASITCLEIKG
jgi:hypothetical protein